MCVRVCVGEECAGVVCECVFDFCVCRRWAECLCVGVCVELCVCVWEVSACVIARGSLGVGVCRGVGLKMGMVE